MDRLRLGLVLLAMAPVSWIIALSLGDGASYIPPLLVMFVGLAFVWWAVRMDRPWATSVGFLVTALGVVWFYEGSLFGGAAPLAGALVILGCLIGAGDALRPGRGLAIGLFVIAAGALLWIYADGTEGMVWQPGNALAAAGAGLAGFTAWRESGGQV